MVFKGKDVVGCQCPILCNNMPYDLNIKGLKKAQMFDTGNRNSPMNSFFMRIPTGQYIHSTEANEPG